MRKKFKLLNKIISLLLCLTMIFPFIPTITIAASENVEIEETIDNYDSNILVYSSDTDHGRVAEISRGGNYRIYKIDHVYTGYAFSHWEVYFTGDYKGGSLTNEDDVRDGTTYFFSEASDTSEKYDKYSDTIRVNLSSDAEGTYYVRAVFMQGYRISVNIDEQTNNAPQGGAEFLIRDINNSDKEESGVQSANWVVAKNTEIQIGAMTSIKKNTLFDRIYINGVDKTDIYTPYLSGDVWRVSIYFGWPAQEEQYLSGIQSNIDIRITTKPMEYTINFHGNGATSGNNMESQVFKYKKEQAINKNTFTRDGYLFTGWNTKADGTGDFYSDEQKITMGTQYEAMYENATYITDLYAQWELPMADYTTPPTAKKLTYNTLAQELVSAGVTNEGTLMYSLEENGTYTDNIPTATNANTYKVWYYIKGDSNHRDGQKASVEAEITKADPEIGTVSGVVNDTTDTSAIVLERTDNTVEGNLLVDAGQTLKLGDNEITYTFTPNDTSNYNSISEKATVTVKDTISPTGTVTITDAKTVWDRVLETITFGLYFNLDQEVVVEATDSFSGIEKIEYYETDDVLDLNGINALPDEVWTEMNDSVVVTVEDAKQFIYYIRITDKSGNIGYISTNGAEFDTTAPAINGIYANKTYYTSQKVSVADKNLDTVTLNGEIVSDEIILKGNEEATYTIVATDKAGNSTTVMVKMAMLDDINSDNVTIEDKTELEEIKTELEKELEENAYIYSDEEKKAVEDKIKEIDEALKVIYAKEANSNTNNANNPQTGDNIVLFIAILAVSIIGLVVTMKIRKKLENN